eukprot:580857-Pleurochrysis_carterae.AAC.4
MDINALCCQHKAVLRILSRSPLVLGIYTTSTHSGAAAAPVRRAAQESSAARTSVPDRLF